MRNQVKTMFIVSCVALVAAVVFTVLYAVLGWYEPFPEFSTLLVVLWVLAVLVFFYTFQLRWAKREEMVRRFYLSPEWMYNHEIGYAPLSRIVKANPYEFVMYAGNALAKMSYDFEVAEAPEDFTPTLLVTSKKFSFHFTDDSEDPADKGVVIDKWTGTVQKAQVGADGNLVYEQVGSYTNATNLAMILDAQGAFDLQYEGNEDRIDFSD